jgi:hypothetical protein
VVYFVFFNLNTSVKIYTIKCKMHYKWDLGGISLDILYAGPS